MNVVVLCGGIGPERDVSITSGTNVAKALRSRGHRAIVMDLYFGYTGTYTDPLEVFGDAGEITPHRIHARVPDTREIRALRGEAGDICIGGNVIEICRRADIVFMALHGDVGENGKIQATFDLYGIRYTGSDYLGSALAMHKGLSKEIFVLHSIPTPPGRVVGRDCSVEDLPLPCVVKPCSGGSSVGVSVVTDRREMKGALEVAFGYEEKALVETYIKGREFAVGIIAGAALPVIEIRPKNGFFDYKSKYQEGMSQEICPADLDPAAAEMMRRTALRVFAHLKLTVYARIDFLMDEAGAIFCLEANTLPGMTPVSLLPREAAAAGMSYGELCEKIIEESTVKYQ